MFDDFEPEPYEDDYRTFEDNLALEDAEADMRDIDDDPYLDLEDTVDDDPVDDFEDNQCLEYEGF